MCYLHIQTVRTSEFIFVHTKKFYHKSKEIVSIFLMKPKLPRMVAYKLECVTDVKKQSIKQISCRFHKKHSAFAHT